MTTLEIIPNESANGVAFGAARNAVEAVFGQPNGTFKKTMWSKGISADYRDFHIYYDETGAFEAIEVFEAKVVLPNSSFSIPTGEDSVLRAIPSLKADEYGLTAVPESVGATVEDGSVVTILFGRAGYYA